MIGLLLSQLWVKLSPYAAKLAALVAVLAVLGAGGAMLYIMGKKAAEREEMDRRLEALRRGEEIRREVDALDDDALVDGILRQPR